jgi:hypothetical protein
MFFNLSPSNVLFHEIRHIIYVACYLEKKVKQIENDLQKGKITEDQAKDKVKRANVIAQKKSKRIYDFTFEWQFFTFIENWLPFGPFLGYFSF